MTEGDELLAMIREIVTHHGVPPQHRAVVTDTAARVCIAVISQPHFYENLSIVIALRQQNEMLRQQLAQVSALVYRANLVPKPPPKKRPAKKPVVRSPKITTKAATKAFKRGASGR